VGRWKGVYSVCVCGVGGAMNTFVGFGAAFEVAERIFHMFSTDIKSSSEAPRAARKSYENHFFWSPSMVCVLWCARVPDSSSTVGLLIVLLANN
jgi:hypothetical protein